MLASVGGSYPPSVGGYYPAVDNVNKQDVRGFDFSISHNNRAGDFSYGIKFMGSYAKLLLLPAIMVGKWKIMYWMRMK